MQKEEGKAEQRIRRQAVIHVNQLEIILQVTKRHLENFKTGKTIKAIVRRLLCINWRRVR